MRNSILSLWSFIYIILMFFVTISCCQSISLMYNWPSGWILSLGRMLNIASTLGIVPFKYYFVVIYCVADGESRHLSIGALSKIFPNKGGLFQSFHRKLEFLQLCRFLILIFFGMVQYCRGLTLLTARCRPSRSITPPPSTGQGEKNAMKSSWIKVRGVRSLTNYHHGQNTWLEEINLIYLI